jgi:hypothetical protein
MASFRTRGVVRGEVSSTVHAWPPSGGAARARARRRRRSRVDGDATRTRGRRDVIGTGRANHQTVLDFGANEFVDLENAVLEVVGGADWCSMSPAATSGSGPQA